MNTADISDDSITEALSGDILFKRDRLFENKLTAYIDNADYAIVLDNDDSKRLGYNVIILEIYKRNNRNHDYCLHMKTSFPEYVTDGTIASIVHDIHSF